MKKLWKHINEGQRQSIVQMLTREWSLKAIAQVVGVDPTAVSREIKRNRVRVSQGPECPKLKRYPFVCNGCGKKNQRKQCLCAKWKYISQEAETMTQQRLRYPRRGLDISEDDFKRVDAAIMTGLKAGKSPYAISKSPEVKGTISLSTMYSWINMGFLNAKKMDLPRAAKLKKRAKKAYMYDGSSKRGNDGRSYFDYLKFRRENPGLYGVQMDFLGSIMSDQQAILVLIIPELHFAFGKKLPKHNKEAVAGFFDELEQAIGLDAMKALMPFVLTDNDPCFVDAIALEFTKATGEQRTRLFYCDPYVSNQKASVENLNSQLRKYFPKKGSVDKMGSDYVAQAFDNINSTPIKSLGGETPKKAFAAVFGEELLQALVNFIKD